MLELQKPPGAYNQKSMLDFRALIAAVVLVAAAAGGYFVWIHRTRAGYHARSLSASNHPATTQPASTRTLHVEGCDKDFLVKTSGLVEPRAIPGAPLATFESIYGPPERFKHAPAGPNPAVWEEDPFTITEDNGSSKVPYLNVTMNLGHVTQTLDDIELGVDSFAAIFRKARDRNIEIHERIRRNADPVPGIDGPSWTLTVSLASSCSPRFRSEYSRTLAADAELDRQIEPLPPKPGGPVAVMEPPLRSSVFMNKVAASFTMVPSKGSADSEGGSISEHH